MEESAIREGFANLRPGSDYDNLYHSALCRQRADWLVGLNGTRLFTVLYGGKVLKVGRVQTPTLAMLVEREEKIRNFKKEPYYTAHILTGGMDAATEKIAEKAQAEGIAAACESKTATVVSVTKEKKTVQPPKLYDLTTLQRDANRLFGFTAKQTLEYTQSLYEKKLVTYPRTDSQYLSDDMEDTARAVIGAVYKAILFEELSGAEPDTLLSRCGADMDFWKDELDFDYISEFNTTMALSVIGNATTDMCRPLLMEIGRTVAAYDRQKARQKAADKARERTDGAQAATAEKNPEKTLANEPEPRYNALKRESESEPQTETTTNHIETEGTLHGTDIREERGLPDTQPDAGQRAGGAADQVRADAEELPEGTPEGDLQHMH